NLCPSSTTTPTSQLLGAEVVAISSDCLESHAEFACRLGIPFPLASDPDLAVARAFGVANEESGRADRAVFVAGRDGRPLRANHNYNPGNIADYESVIAGFPRASPPLSQSAWAESVGLGEPDP